MTYTYHKPRTHNIQKKERIFYMAEISIHHYSIVQSLIEKYEAECTAYLSTNFLFTDINLTHKKICEGYILIGKLLTLKEALKESSDRHDKWDMHINNIYIYINSLEEKLIPNISPV